MPDTYMDTPPHGLLITQVDGYPEGLLAVPNPYGSPRIIVPKSQVNVLVLQCHEDIHPQSHIKVLYVLKALYYWPARHVSSRGEALHSVSNVSHGIGSPQTSQNYVRRTHPPINSHATTGLRHRLLRRFQG